jgi:hypothetical protein
MSPSPVVCDAVEDMGRLAAAKPGKTRHVAEIQRFPMLALRKNTGWPSASDSVCARSE